MQLLLVSALSDRPIIKQGLIAVDTSYDNTVERNLLRNNTVCLPRILDTSDVHDKFS